MDKKILKSGDEIVKEFIQELERDESLDKDVVEAISALYLQKKLTPIQLQHVLDSKRN